MNNFQFTCQVLSDYGYEIPQVGRNICCLFHTETNPSARFYSVGSYHCWSAKCGVHFSDGLGALMHLEGCNYSRALEIAAERYGFKAPEKLISLTEFRSIEEAIVKQVIKQKPSAFMSVYKTLDFLIICRDLDKLKKLHMKLAAGEIK